MDNNKSKETASESFGKRDFRVEDTMSKTNGAEINKSNDPVMVPIDQDMALEKPMDGVNAKLVGTKSVDSKALAGEKPLVGGKPFAGGKPGEKVVSQAKKVAIDAESDLQKNVKKLQIAVKESAENAKEEKTGTEKGVQQVAKNAKAKKAVPVTVTEGGDSEAIKDESKEVVKSASKGAKAAKTTAVAKVEGTREVATTADSQLAVVKKDKALPAKMSDVAAGSTKKNGARKEANSTKKAAAAGTAGAMSGATQRRGAAMDMVAAGGVAKSAMKKDADVAGAVKPEKKWDAAEKKTDAEKKKKRLEKPFSRPKAFLFAAIVAVIVAVIGGLLVWAFSPKAPQYCLVQFESNGGSLIEDEEVVCGETIERPEDPSKEGFDFKDWLYEGKSFGFGKTKVNQDMILLAEWSAIEGTEVVKVTFDSDGGSEVKEIELAKGQTTPAPIAPTRDGYTFVGWYLGDEEFTFADPIEEDITLRAKWEKAETPQSDKNESTRPQEPAQPNNGNSNNSGSQQSKPRASALSAANQEMKAGSTLNVTVGVVPESAEYRLSASSSNGNVATCHVVSGNRLNCGTANSTGSTLITVRDEISGRMTSFTITVKPTTPSVVPVSGVTVSGNTGLKVGETTVFSAQVLPDNAANKTVTWSSSDTSVATVDASGNVTAVGQGTAVITATADGVSGTLMVTVAPVTEEIVTPGGGGEVTE